MSLTTWTGPLPKEELFPHRKYNPLLHWLYHPILRHLSRHYLKILQKHFGLTVIGITGSYGKTTTKDMLYALLKNSAPTVASVGNITSTYNIPKTILRCTPWTKYLILEMGVEYPGDMDFYLWLVHPDFAIITGIGLTHTQYLGNLQNIKSEKFKITKYAQHIITYENTKISKYNLPILGDQFNLNASLAAKAAEILGVKPNFSNFVPPPHRMKLIKLTNNNYLIDDTYNANPEAVKASLNTLVEFSKSHKLTPVFIFGQMNELGTYSQSAHAEIGKFVKKLNIKKFYCLGEETKFSLKSAGFGQFFTDLENLESNLLQFIKNNSNTIILIKGSRSWNLEKLVSTLMIDDRK